MLFFKAKELIMEALNPSESTFESSNHKPKFKVNEGKYMIFIKLESLTKQVKATSQYTTIYSNHISQKARKKIYF